MEIFGIRVNAATRLVYAGRADAGKAVQALDKMLGQHTVSTNSDEAHGYEEIVWSKHPLKPTLTLINNRKLVFMIGSMKVMGENWPQLRREIKKWSQHWHETLVDEGHLEEAEYFEELPTL